MAGTHTENELKRIPKRILQGKVHNRRRKGRPRSNGSEGLGKKTEDRTEWRTAVGAAKTHPGRYCNAIKNVYEEEDLKTIIGEMNAEQKERKAQKEEEGMMLASTSLTSP
ncbi:hypothetical protein ANN_17867 [Periplaneta americana]|uniref:Uncharacterized protein n=1 Tax=Periplaneta americana TaxID=6978 RepID=A0ABQ8SVQ6_PERAM|nr:hypothetical protein ANN_17867 [Periplaneta americana]